MYKYRLVLPSSDGSPVDIYLSPNMMQRFLYDPLHEIFDATKETTQSIVTNDVTYPERGYYRYTNLVHDCSPILRLLKNKTYKIILKFDFINKDNYILIKPSIFHKIFFFNHKLKNLELSDLKVNKSSIHYLFNKLPIL